MSLCHFSSTVRTKGGAIAIVSPEDVTTGDCLVQLVKLTSVTRHIHILKMNEVHVEKQFKSTYCIAPGCSNSFYTVLSQEKPVHFRNFPL